MEHEDKANLRYSTTRRLSWKLYKWLFLFV